MSDRISDKAERLRRAQRRIDKLAAIRHLLHAGIRSHFAEEDPFALHLVASSCDKLLTDYAKKSGKALPLSFENWLKPGAGKIFWPLYRSTYNYFKHGDEDHGEELPVFNIVHNNELLLISCLGNFNALGGEFSRHSFWFFSYMMMMYPDMIDQKIMKTKRNIARETFLHKSRAELMGLFRETMKYDDQTQAELNADLVDVRAVSGFTVKSFAESTPKYE